MEKSVVERGIINGLFLGSKYKRLDGHLSIDGVLSNWFSEQTMCASCNTWGRDIHGTDFINDLTWHTADSDEKIQFFFQKVKENTFRNYEWNLKYDIEGKVAKGSDYYILLPYAKIILESLGFKNLIFPKKFPRNWHMGTLTNFYSTKTIWEMEEKLGEAKKKEPQYTFFYLKSGSTYDSFRCLNEVATHVKRVLEDYGISNIKTAKP